MNFGCFLVHTAECICCQNWIILPSCKVCFFVNSFFFLIKWNWLQLKALGTGKLILQSNTILCLASAYEVGTWQVAWCCFLVSVQVAEEEKLPGHFYPVSVNWFIHTLAQFHGLAYCETLRLWQIFVRQPITSLPDRITCLTGYCKHNCLGLAVTRHLN